MQTLRFSTWTASHLLAVMQTFQYLFFTPTHWLEGHFNISFKALMFSGPLAWFSRLRMCLNVSIRNVTFLIYHPFFIILQLVVFMIHTHPSVSSCAIVLRQCGFETRTVNSGRNACRSLAFTSEELYMKCQADSDSSVTVLNYVYSLYVLYCVVHAKVTFMS